MLGQRTLACIVVICVVATAAASGSWASDPLYDEFVYGDTDGLFQGPCHAGVVDIETFGVDWNETHLFVQVGIRDLSDTVIRCGAGEVEHIHSLYLPRLDTCLDVCAPLLPRLYVTFFGEWEAGWGFAHNAQIHLPGGTTITCFEGAYRAGDTLTWRLPISSADAEHCSGDYSLAGKTFLPSLATTVFAGTWPAYPISLHDAATASVVDL